MDSLIKWAFDYAKRKHISTPENITKVILDNLSAEETAQFMWTFAQEDFKKTLEKAVRTFYKLYFLNEK
jgi:hypothetical protein